MKLVLEFHADADWNVACFNTIEMPSITGSNLMVEMNVLGLNYPQSSDEVRKAVVAEYPEPNFKETLSRSSAMPSTRGLRQGQRSHASGGICS